MDSNSALIDGDFTEAGYASLLDAAKSRFKFVGFDFKDHLSGAAIWRHDIDMSPQRALKMAEIEAALGVQAHYFVMFGSRFYNPCESIVTAVIKKISLLGHNIGLHFDVSAYNQNLAKIENCLKNESNLLSDLTGQMINSFSLHNPTRQGGLALKELNYAGLVNASSPALVGSFNYCSDSNGIWRHRRLIDLVNDPSVDRLYALTHPEWWTAKPLSPRERVQLCIDGRARQVGIDYDIDIEKYGRPNY